MSEVMNSLLTNIGGGLFNDSFTLIMFSLGLFLIFNFFKLLRRF